MTNEQKIEKVESTAEAVGWELLISYSGRGMYGATCYGIIHHDDVEVME